MVAPLVEFRNVSVVLVRSRRDLLVVLGFMFVIIGIWFVVALLFGELIQPILLDHCFIHCNNVTVTIAGFFRRGN